MHVQDHFTKFSMLRFLLDKSADSVRNELHAVFAHMGPPEIMQSDNGSEFINKELHALLTSWKVRKYVHGRPYHPQSQGSVERANGNVNYPSKVRYTLRTTKSETGLKVYSFGCYCM